MFCLLVVLVEFSVLAKRLARKTLLRKPNRGEGVVSRKPRPKSAHDFLGLLYCFIVMRPSSLGGGRILRRTLSVRLSVRPVIVTERHVAPPSELK